MDAILAVPMSTADQPSDDDARLLRAFVDCGDREALAEVLRRHLDSCWRVALRMCGNAADAEDVLQDAVLIAMRQARRWRGGSVRAWLLGIVANAQRRLARTARRRERRERSAPPQPEPTGDDELRDAAVAALAELPDAYRAPVCLRYLEGFDFPDIAAALRLRERTARTRVSRGLERLRALLAPRRAGLGAEGVAALIGAAPTPTPPAPVSAAVMKTAATAPLTTTTVMPAIAVSALVAVLAASGIIGARGWRHAVAAPAPMATPGDPVDARSGLERTLDLRIDLAFYHQASPMPLVENHLPPGTVLPYAWPFAPEHLPWTGATVVGKGLRVREAIARIAAQLGLSWEIDDGYVVFFRPMRAEDRAADVAALWPAAGAERSEVARRDAAERLAWSCDKQALHEAIVAAISDVDDRMDHAAARGLLTGHGTPWPTRRRGTLLHAFIHDAALTTEIGRHLARDGARSSPALLYLGGVLRVPEAATALRAAAAWAFAPADAESADQARLRLETEIAIAVAGGELGSAWPDGQPAPLDLLARELGSNPVPLVRLACAHGLARCGDARAVAGLIALWKRSGWSPTEADLLSRATVEAYDSCGDHGSLVPMLAGILGGTDLARAEPAADALACIRDQAAIAPLVAQVRRTDFFSGCVLSALATMRLPEEIEPLRAAGEDAPVGVAELAAGLRVALGDATAVPILEGVARKYPARAQAELNYLHSPEVPEAEAAACRLAATIGASSFETVTSDRSPTPIRFLIERAQDASAPAEAREIARAALWRTHDLGAVEAAGVPPEIGSFGSACPAWPAMLIAFDRGLPPPKATAQGARPTREEAAALVDRLLALSDANRARGVDAAASIHLADPSLPRERLVVALRGLAARDPVAEVRGLAISKLGDLCASDDLDTLAVYGAALRDPSPDVRYLADAGLKIARVDLRRRSPVDGEHLGAPIPDPRAEQAIDQALAGEQPAPPAKTDF